MELHTKKEEIKDHKCSALILGLFEGDNLSPELKIMDSNLNNVIQDSIDSEEFNGEYSQLNLIATHGNLQAKKLLLVGLGKKNELTTEKLRRLSARSSKALRDKGLKSFTTTLHLVDITGDTTTAVVDGIILGLYSFTPYKTVDVDKIKSIEEVTLLNANADDVKKASTIAGNVNYVRNLVNEPAQKVTPLYLAQEAKKLESKEVKVTIFDEKDINKLGMGGLSAVTKGSAEPPKFIILDYNPQLPDPIVFVGKGITFDSGGLDVKPAKYMEDMRCDMAGGATVIGLIKTIKLLGIKKRIIGIIPTCENLIGPQSFKQGDILTAYNGKTIEIWHTDAEGRLILADALSYAEKNYKPIAIIDICTLTGASIIALGHHIVSLMGNDQNLKDKYLQASIFTGEMTWELPLYEDYEDLVKGDIGDVRNTAKESAGPGTITAGLFLKNFIENAPWIHLDIGASGWLDSDKDYKKKGGTGICLRTFVKLIEDWD